LHRLIKVKCSKAPNRVGIRNSTDYSPFGVELDGRTVSGGYRFGFQNQEKDDEIKGEGNSINYTFRMHDPRLGRFLIIDPLALKFPDWSPNAFCNDNAIRFFDPDGRAAEDWIKKKDSKTWEYHSGVQSKIEAEARFGSDTDYMDDGGTYQGRLGDENVGTVTVHTGGLQTWKGGSLQSRDINPFPITANSLLPNPFLSYFNKVNTLSGTYASMLELSCSSFRITNGKYNGSRLSPKIYSSGWSGGSRAGIKTYNMGKVAKGLGKVSFVLGGGMDAYGVYNYYSYGADDPNSVHPAKAVVNTTFGVVGLKLNPVVSILYFGVDSFYPGGWLGDSKHPGAIMDQDRLIRKNQEIIPNFNLYRDLPGGF
jgi:RHS repeat-associated protein